MVLLLARDKRLITDNVIGKIAKFAVLNSDKTTALHQPRGNRACKHTQMIVLQMHDVNTFWPLPEEVTQSVAERGYRDVQSTAGTSLAETRNPFARPRGTSLRQT